MVLVSEVATLAKGFQKLGGEGRAMARGIGHQLPSWNIEDAENLDEEESLLSPSQPNEPEIELSQEKVIDTERRDKLTGNLTSSQRIKMMQLLDDWKEPVAVSKEQKHVRSVDQREYFAVLLLPELTLLFCLNLSGEYFDQCHPPISTGLGVHGQCISFLGCFRTCWKPRIVYRVGTTGV